MQSAVILAPARTPGQTRFAGLSHQVIALQYHRGEYLLHSTAHRLGTACTADTNTDIV